MILRVGFVKVGNLARANMLEILEIEKERTFVMPMPHLFLLIFIGTFAGLASGMFGIGGGILMVPALIYFLDYSREMATGTSLAVLLPPVGIAAVMVFYRQGNVDFPAAIVLAVCLLIGGWLGAHVSGGWNPALMKILFGLFVTVVGLYILYDALKGRFS